MNQISSVSFYKLNRHNGEKWYNSVMKKIILILIIMLMPILAYADFLPHNTNSIKHYGIGVLNKSQGFIVYSEPDFNSKVKKEITYVFAKSSSILYIDTVEKIEIKVINAASFELLVEDLIPVFERMNRPGGELCGDGKRISRMPLYYRFLDGSFGVAAVIDICGIEVIESCRKITVDHLADPVDIDDSVYLRQSHKTESDLGHLGKIYAHSFHLPDNRYV